MAWPSAVIAREASLQSGNGASPVAAAGEPVPKSLIDEIDAAYRADVKPIFAQKCLPCHSSASELPWYGRIPVPYFGNPVAQDMDDGLRHFDLTSEEMVPHGDPWLGPQSKLRALRSVVQAKSMPPRLYLFVHGAARLTDAESEIILRWIDASLPRVAALETEARAQVLPEVAVAGLLPANAQVTGTIDWPEFGRPPAGGADIGFVFQDPGASLDPVMRVGHQIAEVLHTHRAMTWRQAEAEAIALIDRVRLPEPARIARAFPHQLSGGQRQRIAIAAAIAARPRLLIADEPTSALDTIVQAEIVALIGRLVDEDGMSLIFISHDIALAATLADRIAVFRAGRQVEIGSAEDIVARPREAYTRTLIDAAINPLGNAA